VSLPDYPGGFNRLDFLFDSPILIVPFSLRLDDDYIIFRGSEHEASSAHLRGKLILCLSEPLRVQGITLRLTGVSKIS
jgi:hypothetical protein